MQYLSGLLFIVLITYFPIHAQDVAGNLQGRVVNVQGDPVADVNITISGQNLIGTRGAGSTANGLFHIYVLPPGMYRIQLNHVAHHPMIIENVLIRLGKTTALREIILKSRTFETEDVVVTAARPVIDPTSATTGGNLSAETLAPLPVDRNYRTIATLMPQANASIYGDGINIGGSTGIENVYFIDGINVTDPVAGWGGTNLPYNFIQDIEIRTGGYEAEFASALGGVINAVTRSGGNRFYGQAFGFYTSDQLTSKRKLFALEDAVKGSAEYDIGFGLGGPVILDQMWFYLSYNPTQKTEDVKLTGFGQFQDKQTSHLFAGKLSWRPTSKTDVIFTVLGDPSTNEYVNSENPFISSLTNPEVVLGRSDQGTLNLSLQTTYFPSTNLVLRGIISRLTQRSDYAAATERGRSEPYFLDLTSGLASGGWGGYQNDRSTRTDINVNATLFSGDHTFKAGLAFEEISEDRDYRFSTTVRFADSAYSIYTFITDGKVFNRIPGIFIQDSWAISTRFHLNLGVRWDAQYLYDGKGDLGLKITDQIQPRIGVMFQPGLPGTQKIYASYGRFYERVPTLLTSIQFLNSISTSVSFDHDPRIDPGGGDSLILAGGGENKFSGVSGQYTDEFTIGYERKIFEDYKIGIRGTYRYLGEVLEDAFDENLGYYVLGNPGKGGLSFLPEHTRIYTALEFTLEKFGGNMFYFMASYVLSRNYGNYTGLFDSDYGAPQPNLIPGNDLPELLFNAKGLLPNDHTHVFKFFGSYHTDFGLDVGTSFLWKSGFPLNDFGASSFDPTYAVFLKKRGTAGRTPDTWDLNIRLTYDLGQLFSSTMRPKLIVDVFHVFGQREALDFDQKHYYGVDENGNQIFENPDYLKPVQYQEPMSLRLGVQVDF